MDHNPHKLKVGAPAILDNDHTRLTELAPGVFIDATGLSDTVLDDIKAKVLSGHVPGIIPRKPEAIAITNPHAPLDLQKELRIVEAQLGNLRSTHKKKERAKTIPGKNKKKRKKRPKPNRKR